MENKTEYFGKRYEYLINARNFHYDNFLKWMTFFYVAIGALFAGYCTLPENIAVENKLLIIFLGYIISILWHWSCKGYYSSFAGV